MHEHACVQPPCRPRAYAEGVPQRKFTHARMSGSAALFACLPLSLSACVAVDDSSATATSASFEPSSAARTHASGLPSLVPSAEATGHNAFVNAAGGWSIVVPRGWKVAGNINGDAALTRGDGGIAEILVSPASNLTLEQLEAQKVDDLSAWPGAEAVEAQIVRLPAGEAVRVSVTVESIGPNAEPLIFILYVIEEGEKQYAISVRGPPDDPDLLDDAEALAESFTTH